MFQPIPFDAEAARRQKAVSEAMREFLQVSPATSLSLQEASDIAALAVMIDNRLRLELPLEPTPAHAVWSIGQAGKSVI